MMDNSVFIPDFKPTPPNKWSAFELMDRTSQMNDFLHHSIVAHEALTDEMDLKVGQVSDLLGEIYQLAAQQFRELSKDEK